MSEARAHLTRTLTYLLLLFSPAIYPAVATFNNVETTCKQSLVDKQLRCDFRLIRPEPVLSISAKFEEKLLVVKDQKNYPWKDAITAILLLVDTSDPARAKVIKENNTHIKQLLNASKKYHRIGLASFDKTLRLEVPIGLSNDQILNATERLRATGQTTELYRSVLSAIDLLDQVDADRKSIYLFSDGLAEDTAYFHNDVVSAARKAGVVITSFGYPRSVSQSVALQTLRRLSEETGGLFIEADYNFNIATDILSHPFETIDNGGSFIVDLSSLPLTPGRNYAVDLSFETDTGNYNSRVPLSTLSVETPGKIPDKTPVSEPANITKPVVPSPEIRVVTKESPEKSINLWFWYGVPVFLVILLIATLTILILVNFRQHKKQDTGTKNFTEFKPYAYLVVQDESKKRYAITRTTWRIGRGKDNEMTLNDSSVSRRHAEIHRDKGDVFTVYDLDSLNGVYVNTDKVTKHILHEGDIIEIGDINLRFTLLSTEYALEEATSMQNTRAPITH